MSVRYDSIILGAGPAGLSAAITLKLRNKNVLVISSEQVSEKVSKAHEINNYLGIPKINGYDLAKHFKEHADSLGIELYEKRIVSVYSMGEMFSLQSSDNSTYEASTVVIATGISFGKPYDGEEEFLGRGVSYCATCDANLYKNKCVAVIGSSKKEEAEAKFLSEIAAKVTYIPVYEDAVDLPDTIRVVRDKVVRIHGSMKANALELEHESLEVDGIFILRENVSPAQLVPGLKLEENHVVVNRQMETSIKGCFACGDITGLPYQYIKAAGEGNVAALSVVNYLKDKK